MGEGLFARQAKHGITGNLLIRPWNGQELLPPSWGHIRDIETKNKGERNKVQEGIKIFYNALKKPEKKTYEFITILITYNEG